MADIFISYRRGETDKWVARWLNDRLADSFDVFFDGQRESIDLGASFPDEIDEALAQCRVVFAVIGPDWLDPKNLARLKDEDDWVRRELHGPQPPARPRRPLLVESAAPPDQSVLPPDLESLSDRQAHRLTDRGESDYRDLESRLREWLSKRPAAAEPRSSVPGNLPFLCDRRDQEEAFVELAYARPSRPPDSSRVSSTATSGSRMTSCSSDSRKKAYWTTCSTPSKKALRSIRFGSVERAQGRFSDELKSVLKAEVVRRRSLP